MKRIISILCVLCLLMSFTAISVTAQEIPEGLEYQIANLNFDNWVIITGYTGNATELIIPETIEGYPVTSIREAIFGCDSLISITIPATVTNIGINAFYCCELLTDINVDPDNTKYYSIDGVLFDKTDNSIVAYPMGKTNTTYSIPSGITSIGRAAFFGSKSLREVVIPDSVISIGDEAFWRCEKLTDIAIPDTVLCIGSSAFEDCTSLVNVSLSQSITSISDSLFNCCESLKNITIPPGVMCIGHAAFDSCSSLQSITIPTGITSIGENAFYGCSLIRSIAIPSSVTSIGEHAFTGTAYYNEESNWDNGVLYIDNCLIEAKYNDVEGLYTVKEYTTIIADSAFSHCSGITSIAIPSSLTSIGNKAFHRCGSLTSFTIPKNINSIGAQAFSECISLEAINVDSNNTIFYSIDGVLFNNSNKSIIAYPEGKKSIAYSIPEGIQNIGTGTFYYCFWLTSITIPMSVTRISDNEFTGLSEDFTIYGYTGSYAETYAIENGINFNSIGEVPPVTPPEDQKPTYDMNVYSDRSGMNVQVGESIRLGVELLKGGEEAIDISDIAFVLDDSNIIKPVDSFVKDNIYFVEFEGLKAGTAFVTFSDSVSGFAAQVPVTVYDKSTTSFTLDSIINYVNGYYLKDVASVSGIFADNYSYTVDEKTGEATVSFDAYNSSFAFGAVEVYDANGNLKDAVVLDKYESGATSLKEIFIDNPLHMYSDFVEGNYFSDTFYRAATYSKKTSVSVVIPKGGYISITTDAYTSDIVSIANSIDLLLQVKDLAGDIKGYRQDSSKFIKLTTEKAVEKIIKDSIKPKSIAKKLTKGFSKEFLMTKNSMGDFMDSVVNNINTLDISTFAIETAKGFAFGVGEEVAIALTGGGYKEVIKTLLTVGKFTELGNQYLDFVQSMDCGTISIHNQTGSTRTSEDVTVRCETSFDNDVALKVFSVVPESDLLDTIKATEPELYKAMMNDLSQIYNISMIKNGVETQPEQEVEVYIPISTELLPHTSSGILKVYRVEADGTLTDMNAEREGDFMVFTTDHFSLYVLAVEDVAPEYELGDVNLDSSLNVKDATAIQKHIAGIALLSDEGFALADYNTDNAVNIKDATAIQKFIAGII